MISFYHLQHHPPAVLLRICRVILQLAWIYNSHQGILYNQPLLPSVLHTVTSWVSGDWPHDNIHEFYCGVYVCSMYKSIHCRICTLYVPSYGANHSLTLRYALLCSLLNHKCSPLHTGLCPPVAMLWWMTPTTPSLTTQSGPGWSTRPSHCVILPLATKWIL